VISAGSVGTLGCLRRQPLAAWQRLIGSLSGLIQVFVGFKVSCFVSRMIAIFPAVKRFVGRSQALVSLYKSHWPN